jgi:hypothetical protein
MEVSATRVCTSKMLGPVLSDAERCGRAWEVRSAHVVAERWAVPYHVT